MKIGIVGLGYVGLPLALQFARSGIMVLGFDIDPAKVKKLNRGESYIKHISAIAIGEQLQPGRFAATTDFSRIQEVQAVIICVPTPLTKNREPDISYILDTGRAIAPHLAKGALVVLESTTYPGTTDEDLRGVLEKNSRLIAGVDFHLAFSPEREDPGNPNHSIADVPKLVGGFTPACLARAVELYSHAVKTVVPVSSCRVAEAAKLLENIFRSVNIALVNELKVVYAAMGIDIWEVINAAKTKPFGFMPFYPGPGFGGHCIPIDPFYLTWKAREFDISTQFIELAGLINASMPRWVVERVALALDRLGKRGLSGAHVLVLGVALMVGLRLLVNTTQVGRQMRAVASDREAAEMLGINVTFIIAATFFLGSALAGVAGVMSGLLFNQVTNTIGFIAGLKAFTAAVVGGIGSLPGAMLGGLLLGIAESFITGYVSSTYTNLFVFALLIAVMLVRPRGLLGRAQLQKV